MFRSLRTLRSIPRLKDIAFVLGRHGFHQVAGSLHASLIARIRRLFKREPRHVVQQPERLRLVLEDLGPTFIKFGQLLSTRPDLLSPPYIEELEKLQDDVPAAPFAEIQSILDAEFDGRVSQIFRVIDPVPLATASIAQVHRAETIDGESVVIKVRKHGLEKVIEQDLLVLGLLTDFLQGWPGLQLFDPEGILKVFERSIRRELNFDYERNNLMRLRRNLEDDSKVYIPRAYPEHSTDRVLTMEYLAGEKLASLPRNRAPDASVDEKREQAAVSIADCFLRQIFEHGMFHADAHPGNIILMEDGRIGLIDVGNVGRLTPEMIDELVILLVALVRQDYRALARWILRQGKPTTEINAQTLAMELMDQLDPYYGLSLDEIQLGGLINALFGMVLRYGIRVPSQFVTVARTFVLVEGAVRLCAPHLDMLPHMKPYVLKILRQRWSPGRLAREFETQMSEILSGLKSFPQQLAEVLARASEGRLRVESYNADIKSVERKLDSFFAKVPMAIVTSAVLVASAALTVVPETRVVGIFGLVAASLLSSRLFLR